MHQSLLAQVYLVRMRQYEEVLNIYQIYFYLYFLRVVMGNYNTKESHIEELLRLLDA